MRNLLRQLTEVEVDIYFRIKPRQLQNPHTKLSRFRFTSGWHGFIRELFQNADRDVVQSLYQLVG